MALAVLEAPASDLVGEAKSTAMILKSYTLEIISEEDELLDDDMNWKRVLADMPARLEEIEENLNDMLPNGYRAQIGEPKSE